ncbi:OmpA family protein [Variovorax arabinosiphilus]|uniref:OmpA family protein n=1 Tax=Variovorax arabinosiphilus TaxID=3053498 RepID=UPI00257499F2|nr:MULTISPECIES: OmpA family protein [unclassified Variovorax]MDM0121319.1 OmpA family protein [Variovorax sp. J2L1-78]MDM0130380.1 OmpA family protein [Variovorax sp. J2L1-63]MDM0234082.1 OmpA family protein [Variovorax sp. J2R1-6]
MKTILQTKTPVVGYALPLIAACVSAIVTIGCAAPSHTITPEMQARAAADNPAPPKDADFPAMNSAKWQQGSFPSLEALRAMRTGMGKDQVRELLSFPHFSEGLGGVREWNYIFHFRTGAGPEYITCQYMVRFNADVLTNGMYWKGPGCADLLAPAVVAAKPTPPVVPPPPVVAAKTTLGADGLFRFDRSAEGDLLPDGRQRVERLAAALRGQAFDQVVVTGHTDRLGSTAYNDALSLARAQTVRQLLVQNGVDAARVRAEGKGERQPVAHCAGTARTPELIACLQPDRRVEIEVTGLR